ENGARPTRKPTADSATTGQAAGEDGAAPEGTAASGTDAEAKPVRSSKAKAEQASATSKKAKAPKQAKAKAVKLPVKIDVEAVRDALGRQKFFQESAARTATPGVATGLAVTGTGGDVLFVEATAMKPGSGGGGLVLTGQLGDVMKESAQIALSYVRGHAE